jgi:hypothetical protein
MTRDTRDPSKPGLGYSGEWFPPCLGLEPGASCCCRPCLIASTMILAPIPTITMPATIWPVTRTRATSVVAVMSPNPTVANTVTVKYKASVRVKGSLKLPTKIVPMTKYVAANSSRNSGTLSQELRPPAAPDTVP